MSSAFNTSTNFIHHLELVGRISLQNKQEINEVFIVRLIPRLYLFLFQAEGPRDYNTGPTK